jgi:hypothetical protein
LSYLFGSPIAYADDFKERIKKLVLSKTEIKEFVEKYPAFLIKQGDGTEINYLGSFFAIGYDPLRDFELVIGFMPKGCTEIKELPAELCDTRSSDRNNCYPLSEIVNLGHRIVVPHLDEVKNNSYVWNPFTLPECPKRWLQENVFRNFKPLK